MPRDAGGGGRTETVLVTGAAGRIGTYLRSRLRKPERTLRLLDVTWPATETRDDGLELCEASVTDLSAMIDATAGVDAVVHLAAIASPRAAWTDISHVNIQGTSTVFEAARIRGVRRIVYASSNHAAGFGTHRQDDGAAIPRADSFYGVSKVFGEALGSLYHDQYDMDVVCLRIGSCFDRPRTERMLATWLSPDDSGRLVEAALSHPAPGYTIVWGVSDNRRRTWPLEAGTALGYHPRDDAETYAAEIQPVPSER